MRWRLCLDSFCRHRRAYWSCYEENSATHLSFHCVFIIVKDAIYLLPLEFIIGSFTETKLKVLNYTYSYCQSNGHVVNMMTRRDISIGLIIVNLQEIQCSKQHNSNITIKNDEWRHWFCVYLSHDSTQPDSLQHLVDRNKLLPLSNVYVYCPQRSVYVLFIFIKNNILLHKDAAIHWRYLSNTCILIVTSWQLIRQPSYKTLCICHFV